MAGMWHVSARLFRGEGYCSTNGVSVNGKDDQAIVRIIDAAIDAALNPAREDVK
jgi:hypothetical protein